jgi:pimeloyl-ACP methyl ester carboxylesterase
MLVAGEREQGFVEACNFAEQSIPGIRILRLNAGHAVNLEAADEFNRAVMEFMQSIQRS